MTPTQLEDAARDRYNAVGDPHFSQDMLMNVIYQACMVMANECFAIQKTFTTTSTADTNAYSFPSEAIAIRRVEYKGVKLFPVDLEADPKTQVTTPTGTPGEYAIWANELILFPTPDTTSDEIKVFSFNEPQTVTASSTLEVPSEYHLDILDLMLSVMYAKDQNNNMSTYHRNLWERSINRIKRTEAKKKRGDQFAVVREQGDVAENGDIYMRGTRNW